MSRTTMAQQTPATVESTVQEVNPTMSPTLRLRLQEPQSSTSRHVAWANGTVDNEHMGKKKSKCCCVYQKPRKWDESDSESSDDDECDHCQGHVEKKKKNQPQPSSGSPPQNQPSGDPTNQNQ